MVSKQALEVWGEGVLVLLRRGANAAAQAAAANQLLQLGIATNEVATNEDLQKGRACCTSRDTLQLPAVHTWQKHTWACTQQTSAAWAEVLSVSVNAGSTQMSAYVVVCVSDLQCAD